MDVTVCSTVWHIQVSNICIEWNCHVSLNNSCNHQSFQSHLIYSYKAWNLLSLGQLTNRHDAWNHIFIRSIATYLSPANKKMTSCLSIWCCKKTLFIHLLYQYRVIKSFAYCFSAFSSSSILSIVILLLSGVADICIVAPTTSRTTLLFSCMMMIIKINNKNIVRLFWCCFVSLFHSRRLFDMNDLRYHCPV